MASSTTGKGKSADRSTPWSENKWDKTRQQWYTSRRNESGEKEYYWYPSETTAVQEDPSVPRSFDQTSSEVPQDQSYYHPTSETAEFRTVYGPVATSSYGVAAPSGPAYATTPSYTTATTSANTTTDPYYTASASYPTSNLIANNALPTGGSPEFSTASTPGTGTGYPLSPYTSTESPNYDPNYPSDYFPSPTGGTTTSADSLTSTMATMNLASQATVPEQGQLQASSTQPWPSDAKRIYQTPGASYYEELDPRYRKVADQRKFWKVGRVFMMLWTEPAKEQKVGPNGGTRNGSHFSITWLNEQAYSEIRRFVVIREGHGNSICSPIHTYSGQATLKPNLPERQQHAIIYTSERPPAECSYNAADGTVVKENLSKDPIKVIREQPSKEGDLGEYSRINYSKIYTVEYYVRVLNIGMVDRKSLESLETNSYVRPPTAPIERPTSYPPPANPERRNSKDKHKSKGKGKPSEHGGGRRRH